MSSQKSSIPRISIIIPTRNSEKVLPYAFRGIRSSTYPKNKVEIIIVDNNSSDDTLKIARRFRAKTFSINGQPPRVCQQRNLGAQKASGDYLIFLDHDMEISKDLLTSFSNQLKREIDKNSAWYIPEKIITSSKTLTKIRNFERQFYNATPIDAVRIIKRSAFVKDGVKYDPKLSGGPADWDIDIQLKSRGYKFDIISKPLFHHEERLGGLLKYVLKKSDWMGGINIYKRKWQYKYRGKYQTIIKQQFGLKYRVITVFSQNGNWKKIIKEPVLYLAVLCIKLSIFCLSQIKGKLNV